MSRWMKTILLLAMWNIFTALAFSQDLRVSGRVTDGAGNPVPAVFVHAFHRLSNGGYETVETKTDEDGRYVLSGDQGVIFFRKRGYSPATRVLSADSSVIDVTVDREHSGWKLQKCTKAQQENQTTLGEGLVFTIPPEARPHDQGRGGDSSTTLLFFPGDPSQRMWLSSGGTLGGGMASSPQWSWYVDGSSITERSNPDSGALDVHGKMPNGRNWRSMSIMTDIAEYHGVTDEAAEFFDRILDSACLRDWDLKK